MDKKNIIISVLVLILAVVGYNFFGTGENISPQEAEAKVMELIAMNPENPAVVKEVVEENDLYKITVSIGEQEFYSYLSKNGEMFFPEMIDLNELIGTQEDAPKTEVSKKSNKPTVELFVMSHCPFGTQAEKGILPVVETLGDKIDFELKFCDYAMHDKLELNEQTQQYCIKEEQGQDKLLEYLNCFLEAGDSSSCLSQTGINKTSLQTCIDNTNNKYKTLENYENKETWASQYPAFDIYKEDNLKYNIEGSPELVINGEKISTNRDSNSLLATICSAFNDQPSECEQELSSETPSPGFGFSTTANQTNETCN